MFLVEMSFQNLKILFCLQITRLFLDIVISANAHAPSKQHVLPLQHCLYCFLRISHPTVCCQFCCYTIYINKRQLQAQLCHLDSFVFTICHYHLSFLLSLLLSLPFVITICHFSLPFSFHFSFCICIKYFNHLSARLACQ